MKYLLPLCALLGLAQAQIPNSMLFQGVLYSGGSPVNGEQELVIKFCRSATLNESDCESPITRKVEVKNGYYSTMLDPLPSMDKPYWLEIVANNNVASARIPLSAAPYALRSLVADSALAAARSLDAKHALVADSSGISAKAWEAQSAQTAANATKADTAQIAIQANRSTNGFEGGGALYEFSYNRSPDQAVQRLFSYRITNGWDGGLVFGTFSGRRGSCRFDILFQTDNADGNISSVSQKANCIGSVGGLYYKVSADLHEIEVWYKKRGSNSDDHGRLLDLTYPLGSVTYGGGNAADETGLTTFTFQ